MLVEIDPALKPDGAFEAASLLRDSHQILFVDADIKIHIIALDIHLVNALVRQFIAHFMASDDIAHDLVLVALHAIRHKERIYDRKHILPVDST